jgi:hypothetical protein
LCVCRFFLTTTKYLEPNPCDLSPSPALLGPPSSTRAQAPGCSRLHILHRVAAHQAAANARSVDSRRMFQSSKQWHLLEVHNVLRWSSKLLAGAMHPEILKPHMRSLAFDSSAAQSAWWRLRRFASTSAAYLFACAAGFRSCSARQVCW